jgi:hypothetical protein
MTAVRLRDDVGIDRRVPDRRLAEMRIPAKSKDVFDYLRKCAYEMRTVTREELAQEVGLPLATIDVHLGVIRDHMCRDWGRPWLSALVVNSTTRRPTDAFLPADMARGRDEERMWRGMVLQVFAYDWTNVHVD